jgi:enamine deaminase RidA (YjgF/YER057c/UK114 family)
MPGPGIIVMALEINAFDELPVGGTIRLSGQVATDAAGSDVGTQTREILHHVDTLLAEAGTDKLEIILADIWLRDLATFGEMNAVWDEWMATGRTPHRTTFEDKGMPALFDVRIDIVASLK